LAGVNRAILVKAAALPKATAGTSISLDRFLKAPHSTVFSVEEEAVIVAFRRHTLTIALARLGPPLTRGLVLGSPRALFHRRRDFADGFHRHSI
jgi:hypothetical protein